jgi:hypothetical protein
MKIKEVDYHRNGVCGNGFNVVTFEDAMRKGRLMVGVVFDEPGSCAVFDCEMLGNGIIKFGVNSWRGDDYESALRNAIEEYNG